MKIKSIEITNVKGISNNTFILDLIPNKPNIMVAPNGFGKSSFSIAFESLKPSKLELNDKNYHLGNQGNSPEIKIFVEEEGNQTALVANSTINTISNQFDIFVINSQIAAKATLLKFGGKAIAKPTLEIATTILIPSIPAKIEFDYKLSSLKNTFAGNGKILPDISSIFKNAYLLSRIENDINFSKFSQIKISGKIETIKTEINDQNGTAVEIKQFINNEKINELQGIDELNKLAVLIGGCDLKTISDEVDSFLAALQVISVYQSKGADFKKACRYQYFIDAKNEYQTMINSFNSTRFDIKIKEDKKKGLVIEWPKAHEISNGERDVLSFISLLMKAKRSFSKQNCILIIDEIFDYLDDANLISFQYFITDLIEEMKRHGKNFFPLLMTHLDPMFFNHFCFNRHKIKVHYLKSVPAVASPHIIKLIRNREDPIIQARLDKHYFHYCPTHVNLSHEFKALELSPSLDESQKFHTLIQNQVDNYLNNQANYDPLAICFGVRVRVEFLIYQKINDPYNKQKFIDAHGTKKKLEFCEQIALEVPEYYYLLGIIYNDRLHWRNGIDIVRPVAIKLENLTIKKMIRNLFK